MCKVVVVLLLLLKHCKHVKRQCKRVKNENKIPFDYFIPINNQNYEKMYAHFNIGYFLICIKREFYMQKYIPLLSSQIIYHHVPCHRQVFLTFLKGCKLFIWVIFPYQQIEVNNILLR